MMRLLALTVLALCVASCAHAWGKNGHRITAQIAWNFLNETTRNAVQQQLPSTVKLADISTLPDGYDHRDGGEWSKDMHYVDVPNEDRMFFMDSSSCEEGNCVVNAIANYTAILESQAPNFPPGVCKTDGSQEPCPLSFLVHFVGDCHQPLHVAYVSDKGGNSFDVSFFGGAATNLHYIWDDDIIDKYLDGAKWTVLSDELTAWASENRIAKRWIQAEESPRVWANESFNIVRNFAYNFIPGAGGIDWKPVSHTDRSPRVRPQLNVHKRREMIVVDDRSDEMCSRSLRNTVDADYVTYVGQAYYDRAIEQAKGRLVEGGLRLATLLSKIYG